MSEDSLTVDAPDSVAVVSMTAANDTGSSTYDLLLGRLAQVAAQLTTAATELNTDRAAAFETIALELGEQERFSTNVPAIPRDVVALGDVLLVAVNPGPGLRQKYGVEDLFGLFRVTKRAIHDWDLTPIALDDPTNFLNDASFKRDIGELVTYYADFRISSLSVHNGQLLMVFGVGSDESDSRVLRWRLGDPPVYVDAYGDHDVATPERYDFAWTEVDRGLLAEGRWSHFNVADVLFVGIGRTGLEFRIDDAVEGGRTILTETLAEPGQDVGEIRMSYAALGDVVLLRVSPYRETTERFYVYNRLTRVLQRADAIGLNCHRLPDNQGVVFPGGFHLANGETKLFATDADGFELHGVHRSPNGEDLLYAFHRRRNGDYLLLPYNLVRRAMATPVACHGYALHDDGTVVVVRDTAEPQRVHAVGIYNSPYCAPEKYRPNVGSDTFLGRIGNPELVRALGESLSLARDAAHVEFNAALFEALVARAGRLIDTHAWLDQPEAHGMGPLLGQVRRSAAAVLDEFASVAQAKRDAATTVADAERRIGDFIASSELPIRDTDAYVELLANGRTLLGELSTIADRHHVDKANVLALAERVSAAHETLGVKALDFLAEPSSLDGLQDALASAEANGRSAETASAVSEAMTVVDTLGDRIVMLTDVVGSLDVADPTGKTAVLTRLSDLLARRNLVRATLDGRGTELRTTESAGAFQAAVAVLAQRATASLQASSTPAVCDQALAALYAELESLELRFGDVAAFADVLATRRDEFHEAFAQRRDAFATERAQHIDRLVSTTQRVLATASERASALADRAAIDGFFAADPLVARVRRAIADVRELGDAGRAAELEAALAASRDHARRIVVDRSDLFDAEGRVRIGKWAFGVNKETFDLRLATRSDSDALDLRLTGTDLALPLPSGELPDASLALAAQVYPSETSTMSRALFLAFAAIEAGVADVRAFASDRLDDGFEIGVHDTDAARIIDALAPWWAQAALRVAGAERSVAGMWLGTADEQVRRDLAALRALGTMQGGRARSAFADTYGAAVEAVAVDAGLTIDKDLALDWLIAHGASGMVSPAGRLVAEETAKWATSAGLDVRVAGFGELVRWIADLAPDAGDDCWAEAAWALHDPRVPSAPGGIDAAVVVDGLVSQHTTIADGRLAFEPSRAYTDWLGYRRDLLPRFRAFSVERRRLLERWRGELALDSLRPRVMSSFVRNRLIDEVYLPLIGDNLARQLGMNGANQGLLLLISPPGYGKTSLVEYVCDLLGFALVRISGPALGSHVTSLDPAAAPDAASRAELIKLNRGLAMASNVVVYLDDIQHTSPELLQKFIPLTDATRRIDGVLEGQPRSYDLAGRRAAVVMAGNPYTSDGATFRIPDMLANRADVYNLGDVASDSGAAAFAQSYVEIGCGVNPVLAPVLARSRADLGRLMRAAVGEAIRSDQLSHAYAANELNDVLAALRHLSQVRDALLKVNSEYMRSASLDDAMRGEPAFLLQGSYRNMTRIASRIIPAMTSAEIDGLITDHYRAESQTLATASRWNLARLAQVLGRSDASTDALVDDLRARWKEAKVADDPMAAVASALRGIEAALRRD
jgi:ATPase involved in DNA repair/ATPase family associated with various cellular activities (AAA)